ncbi:transmembrane protein 182 isoform X2 [Triplophysa rosa]|uniref:Transmembrane protein 182 n=1 Tax=Triplophysa rosa TaxID=992332 RepID=A0A9W7WVA8_TRIRA|nr:transmembrane protein 182 isoform X2 [Triplophysa rosa]KAI7808986.1 transmembrane protein 182 precursor [Triplophysa rosa]
MKLHVALFFAGLFGALATLFILLSFGTDYWLLASETCKAHGVFTLEKGGTVVNQDNDLNQDENTFYHEGFFWRCSFDDSMSKDDDLWKFWFENQAHAKVCKPAYLLPFPFPDQNYNITSYQTAIIYRGFWSVSMLLGVVAVVAGGFIIICAAPFTSHRLYKAGGGLYLISGFFLLIVTVMYVIWLDVLDVMSLYVDYQISTKCTGFKISMTYGLSFMLAPVGVFFCFLSGLLFLAIGRTVKQNDL